MLVFTHNPEVVFENEKFVVTVDHSYHVIDKGTGKEVPFTFDSKNDAVSFVLDMT